MALLLVFVAMGAPQALANPTDDGADSPALNGGEPEVTVTPDAPPLAGGDDLIVGVDVDGDDNVADADNDELSGDDASGSDDQTLPIDGDEPSPEPEPSEPVVGSIATGSLNLQVKIVDENNEPLPGDNLVFELLVQSEPDLTGLGDDVVAAPFVFACAIAGQDNFSIDAVQVGRLVVSAGFVPSGFELKSIAYDGASGKNAFLTLSENATETVTVCFRQLPVEKQIPCIGQAAVCLN